MTCKAKESQAHSMRLRQSKRMSRRRQEARNRSRLAYLLEPFGFSTNFGGVAVSPNCHAVRYASRRMFAIFL
jgi:hypothetical protein